MHNCQRTIPRIDAHLAVTVTEVALRFPVARTTSRRTEAAVAKSRSTTAGRTNTTLLRLVDTLLAKTQKQATGPDMASTITLKSFIANLLTYVAILCFLSVVLLLWVTSQMGGMCIQFYKRLKKSFVR